MRIWTCKIGEIDEVKLPNGADQPMRDAVAAAYSELTGARPSFIFSGWAGELTEGERAVVENRDPKPLGDVDVELLYSTTDALVWATEFAKVCPDVDVGLMIGWFANAMGTAERFAEAAASARLGSCEQHTDALVEARKALRLTREYVGEGLLPAKAGWSWFDATVLIDALVGPPEIEGSGPSASGETE